ncbi:hypothetical protein BGZ92_011847 [Podila epicladia]|nr:hypothetical protein BGZ92_011847 [Podila epicladia]
MWWTHHDLSLPVHGDFYNGQTKKNSDESLPWTWPFLNRGLNYFSSKETNHYVYLMGNPLLWWASSITAIVYMFSCIWSAVNYIRGKPETKQERARFGITPFYAVASGTFYAGWAIHYFPFFFMHRKLYLHHYLPALYFSILLLVSCLDRTLQRWPTRARYTAGLLLLAATILSWHCLAPLAYGTDFSSRSKCEKIRSFGGWEFVCQRQNLPWARPQAAKIVVEKRADHEQHEAQEEAYNSQFYYQDPTHASNAGLHDVHGEHDSDHSGEEEGDHDHDHTGPYNQDESQHYGHEHFHHPGQHDRHSEGHHGHESHGQDAEVKRQAEAAHAQAQAIEERARAEIRARAQEEEQQEQQRLQKQEQEEEEKKKAQKEQEAQRARELKEWESRIALEEAHAKEIQEKADLLAAKEALERKQKELEEKLAAQEVELLRQKMVHEQHAREKKNSEEEEEEEEERQVREKLQKDAQDRERMAKLEEELRQKHEEKLRIEEEEKEWHWAIQQNRLRQEQEYQERLRQEQEHQERLRREEDERRAREEERERYEQQWRHEKERRRAYEERQRYEQEQERQREEQEKERQRQDAARLAVEDQAAMEAAMAAMGAGGDFGGLYGVAQPPPPGVMAHTDQIREMLEEKLHMLQEQVDNNRRLLEQQQA